MAQPTAISRPDCERTTTSATIIKLTCSFNDTYEAIIQRFRLQVPQLDILRIRTATSDEDVKQAVEAARSPSGFVLFAEYNHAGWMRHFMTQGGSLRRAHRFTFGNPLYALSVLQHNIQAALRIPLDCCFIEELEDKRTQMIVDLPINLLAEDNDNGARQAGAELEAKLLSLVESLTPHPNQSAKDSQPQ
ncbi:hypothetical protein EJ04DRAFT_148947 [Polyplosphaeria fusca]|uniref:DUF302 domain-containing protein n=1 Tax=Polyplosphaeria fusca TaxID=682080 RepID=A0A9P4R4I8_9PLEO|nr:hypothetical protein EJ04DRAFT_148947 [Polyplosphaeria fusca]